MQIDESTNKVTGFIDFECSTIAPLWQCAKIPTWLLPETDEEHELGTEEEKENLRIMFLQTVDRVDQSGEWQKAWEKGHPFRKFTSRLYYMAEVWGSKEADEWVEERLLWAKDHPGIGFPESADALEGDTV